MTNDITHFAIHADDCERAKTFYENTFGWAFRPWGPPGFWMIETSPGAAVHGSLQQRSAPLENAGVAAYECTVGVEDVAAIAQAIERHGGELSGPPTTIPGVGTVVMFRDTEGNTVGAMQYETPT